MSFKNRFSVCLLMALMVANFNTFAESTNNGKFIKIDIGKKMLVNKSYSATISVKNTGAKTWARKNGIALSATAKTNGPWKIPPTTLDVNERIKPGETKVFKLKIQSISRTGIYSLRFELQQNGKAFGEKSRTLNIVVETRSNRVKFISQLLPNSMSSGEEYAILVQFKNNGSSTWTRENGYQLQMISRNKGWKFSRVKLENGEIVPPGEIVTFRLKLMAPETPGSYPIQWQMQKNKMLFGETTPLQQVVVTKGKTKKGAEFIYQNLPNLNKSGSLFTILEAGEVYPVTLTFKNSGKKAWRQGLVSLGSQNPEMNMTWSVDRIELHKNEVVKPGGIKTFNFKIITPLKPGIYRFQWQMIEGFNDWIGSKSNNVSVTVK